ncbi:tRNA(Met) cytidine acetyltransferase TmcA [Halorarius halobius]|uniref:tRNA(Met) cytidine acetyltransferase TmcA n=1 Tax=Halorarius halobius TaxID=2962671 RepID=UPI0020CC91D3|nr:tRNA(Met) cytidine acetyltransferase TmcA [Halorarius halobius]
MHRVAAALREEAAATNERRLLVCHGGREATYDACREALGDVPSDGVTVLSEGDILPAEHLPPRRSGELLGTTREAVVVDCHDACHPNALGRAVGAVDGGGLLVLLAPPLDDWPDHRDGFDERLVVPPFDLDGVTGHFRERLVATLRVHPGIALVDADAGTVERDGLTDPAPRLREGSVTPPDDHAFPRAAYDACLTDDQVDAVRALEALADANAAVVVEADRGRGKSSAAGLAAGALAADGADVLVTAPGYRNAAAVFDRAAELLDALGTLAGRDDQAHEVRAASGGRVRFAPPPEASEATADALVVDEAAALPVRLLDAFAAGDRPVAFTTTIHGYEGAGRGFSVRFRDHLADSDREVRELSMSEPIRYAPGDPVETWAFRALLFDAGPAVDPLVADVEVGDPEYGPLETDALVGDDHLLREAFGLLVAAHYRTEPDDLARLLDAPNLTVRALTRDGHVVALALLAWEGNLPASTREAMYEGAYVRGNMIPDVLTSQLRDPEAGAPQGLRVMRIATHPAVRSRGLGSRLLKEIRREFDGDVDYLSVGFGATPDLVRFWRDNGYRTVHLSTSRNDTSGEYSALMVDPVSEAGRALHDRTAEWFLRRVVGVLGDPLSDCDPDVVAAVLAAVDTTPDLDLSEREWRLVAATAFGPGIYDVAPSAFARLALRTLVDGRVEPGTDAARLLATKALQGRDRATVTEELGYVSTRETMRSLGEVLRPLVRTYGPELAQQEANRHG